LEISWRFILGLACVDWFGFYMFFDLGVDHCQLASLDVLLDSGVPVPYLLGMRDGTPYLKWWLPLFYQLGS